MKRTPNIGQRFNVWRCIFMSGKGIFSDEDQLKAVHMVLHRNISKRIVVQIIIRIDL